MNALPLQVGPTRATARARFALTPTFGLKPLALIAIGLATTSLTHAQAASDSTRPALFDAQALKSRGIDPRLAEYFREAPRFSEGQRRVNLQVNGQPRGDVMATFDSHGKLCFDAALLESANLKVPDERFALEGRQSCYDFVAAFAQTEVVLKPNREEVSLLVSYDALRPIEHEVGFFQSGGNAGVFNYDLLAHRRQFDGKRSNYYSGNIELGFNAGDWIVRSRQSFSIRDQSNDVQSLYTYAQKTFVPLRSTLQAGQINIGNSVFAGAAITGVQVLPEAALLKRGPTG